MRQRWGRHDCKCVLYALSLGIGLHSAGRAQEMKPMDPKVDPAYEVATVKPSDPDDQSSGFQLRGERVNVANETVEAMLMFAFGVQKRQIANAPAWVADTHYDVSGIPDQQGQPDLEQMRSMVRKLLATRFHLQVHEEKREMPVYLLEVAKAGLKMHRAQGSGSMPDQTGNHGATADFRFTNNTLDDLAGFLQFEVDRPVLDQTGMGGRFDFELKWTPALADKPAADGYPHLFTAVQEQLGLKLDPAKRPAKVLVLDSVERPSAN